MQIIEFQSLSFKQMISNFFNISLRFCFFVLPYINEYILKLRVGNRLLVPIYLIFQRFIISNDHLHPEHFSFFFGLSYVYIYMHIYEYNNEVSGKAE